MEEHEKESESKGKEGDCRKCSRSLREEGGGEIKNRHATRPARVRTEDLQSCAGFRENQQLRSLSQIRDYWRVVLARHYQL